jgi:hypothetical protein
MMLVKPLKVEEVDISRQPLSISQMLLFSSIDPTYKYESNIHKRKGKSD